jgi:hypothetical protein
MKIMKKFDVEMRSLIFYCGGSTTTHTTFKKVRFCTFFSYFSDVSGVRVAPLILSEVEDVWEL